MSTLDKVKKTIIEEKDNLISNYNIVKIGVFGSVARGEDNENSDIDLIADFSKPIGLFSLVGLEMYLSEKIGKKVEVASRKYLSTYIKSDILKEEQVIYG